MPKLYDKWKIDSEEIGIKINDKEIKLPKEIKLKKEKKKK